MAKKSKTQRAKASARRQKRKEQARIAEEEAAKAAEEPEEEKGKFTKFLESTPLKQSDEEKAERAQYKAEEKKREEREKAEAERNKKPHFQFFRNVRSEMKRVTWPTREDTARWSLVVLGALVFFTAFVLLMDNAIVTPILYLISGLG
ncbi:MAG: preprotein translocase subunit SecE [Eggerthellaceae bacterium]|jgi:preprotein translocase subunit SecE